MRLLALKSILVATDLDAASQPALRTGARLAALADAKLHLLHVASQPEPHAADRLAAHFRAVVGEDAEADVEVVIGKPAETIVAHARKVDASVIVLGPHRHIGARTAMGSTASEVVRTAPCPCLVAAVELNLPLERVLAPIDLSEIAGGALSVALSWASALRPRGDDARLTALHVTTDPKPAALTARSVQQEVERARARAGGAARVAISERVTTAPDPIDAILDHATGERADLIVMGTRGAAGAVSGLGSVSAAVSRVTPCPLLLVPAVTWAEHNQTSASPDTVRAR